MFEGLTNLGKGLGSGAGKLLMAALIAPPAIGATLGAGSVLAGEGPASDKSDLNRAKLRAKIRALQSAARDIEVSKGLHV